MKKQKKLDIEVRAIGKPSISALSEAEQKGFYETLLKRIQELAAEDNKTRNEENNSDDDM